MTINFNNLNGVDGTRIVTPSFAGKSVAIIGDVNGDGIDDFLVSYQEERVGGFDDVGTNYVVFGRSFGATFDIFQNLYQINDGSNGFRITGDIGTDSTRGELGYAVHGLGDFNGDGIDDFAISAPFIDLGVGNTQQTGKTYVIYGGSSFGGALSIATLSPSQGMTILGEDREDRAGRAISGAGDVNGDGLQDLIIGAISAEDGGFSTGMAYVVHGTSSGAGTLDLGSLNGSNGFRMVGPENSSELGSSVSDAGDVNGDGIDDFIVGAFTADQNVATNSGSAFVVFGVQGGFGPSFNLGSLNGSNGFRINGAASLDRAGAEVSSAGDVNGDGFDDLLVGAPQADPNGRSAAGEVAVIFGGASFAPTLNLATMNAAQGIRIFGASALDETGGADGQNDLRHSISSAGDVTGDGIDDILIGVYQADFNDDTNNFFRSGEAYLVYGSRTLTADIDLATLSAAQGERIEIAERDAQLGYAVSGGGDVNGDLIDDVIVGAPFAFNGAAALIYGRNLANDAPVARDDAVTLSASGSATFNLLQDNGFGPDSDVDPGDTLSLSAVDGRTPGSGVAFDAAGSFLRLTAFADGRVEIDPTPRVGYLALAAGQSVQETFTYVVRDSSGLTDDATVTVTIEGVNDAPSARDDAFGVTESGTFSGSLFADNGSGADFDPDDGDGFTVNSVQGVTGAVGTFVTLSGGGRLTVQVDGTFVFDPNGAYDDLNDDETATETVAYEIRDSAGLTSAATATFTVRGEGSPLIGGTGADSLQGTDGADVMRGGRGADTMRGGRGSDDMDGQGGNDRMWGDGGNDTMIGGGGRDNLWGGGGRDRLEGGGAADRLWGGGGRDRLDGGGGNDSLWGNGGNDTLIGGKGRDEVWGGSGRDRFQFARGDNKDVIHDFEDRRDKIVFTSGAESVRDLRIRQQGDDVLINYGGRRDQIVVEDAERGDFGRADFVFA